MTTGGSSRSKRTTLLLSFGYLCVAVAATIAVLNPARGYEASIYSNTPILTLLGVGIALVVSVWLSLKRTPSSNRLPILLGALGLSVLVFLPLIRGYYFLGEYDALTHLGRTKDLAGGVIGYTDLLYPGLHSLSTLVSRVSGFSLPRSLLLTTFTMTFVFVSFVPLLVRYVTGSNRAGTVAFFSALMLLPLNVVKLPVLQPIPTTAAVFYVPCVFYTYTKVARSREARDSALLFITAALLVLLHPQQALGVMLFFAATAGYNFATTQSRNRKTPATWSATFVPIGFLLVVTFAWLSSHTAFLKELVRIIAFLATLSAGAGVTQASSASTAAGTNLSTIFVKVFSVDATYVALAGLYLLMSVSNRLVDSSSRFRAKMNADARSFGEMTAVGLIPIGLLVVMFVLSGESKQYFRYIGTAMAFVTILGALFLWRLLGYLRSEEKARYRGVLFRIGLVIMLVASAAIVHPSPYISKPTSHVPEAQFQGYETAFEHAAHETEFVGLYSPVARYRDGVFGRQRSRFGERVPTIGTSAGQSTNGSSRAISASLAAGNLSDRFNGTRYLPITATDRYRALRQYKDGSLSRSDFRALDWNPDANKIQAGGTFDLYRVE